MCKERPCWGTPAEVRRMIENGFADKLMLDWYYYKKGNVYIIAPAIVGCEKKSSPFWPSGRCALLDDSNKCILHGTDMKPSEAKWASCTDINDKIDIHLLVANTWKNKEARELVKEWKDRVGYYYERPKV